MVIDAPHRRLNPLTGEWVLVSAGRTDRPWLGSTETPARTERPDYDPRCYLCPGNTRAGGVVNPEYPTTFVFDNDFAALRPDVGHERFEEGLLRAESEAGVCRVLCYSPRHDLDLALMKPDGIRAVIDVWAAETSELANTYTWVQVFENRGAAMGASNPHPHGQIWAGAALPNEARTEDHHQRTHWAAHGSPLVLDYALQELGGERVVAASETWVGLVPFWAVWPFEMLVAPLRHVVSLPDLTDVERNGLAEILADVLGRYDRIFDHPFPYSMGWHGAPSPIADHPHWQLHAHFYPPMLRSATVRKHMVGYELLAEKQRDVTPESAAHRLRSL
ncbi:MAG: UDP-glucose--hexose-1-phosphate uridylyltransferase [Acidimicrobiia bacterium]|nr:UDP-glucose--hexose-1-phosphate uridylyltransferase [Acidimicrobiia bacterium]MDH4307264.1 UDP-glucose--hexose-1-phosphate uridylyltransferase [Acidimicrobiia bacterium]